MGIISNIIIIMGPVVEDAVDRLEASLNVTPAFVNPAITDEATPENIKTPFINVSSAEGGNASKTTSGTSPQGVSGTSSGSTGAVPVRTDG